MAFNLIEFLGARILFLAIILAALIFILLVLVILNRRLSKKIITKEEKHEKYSLLKMEIQDFKTSSKQPKELLDSINAFSKNFFKAVYGINQNLDYFEMKNFLEEKQKSKPAFLCLKMIELLYTGKRVTKEDIASLLEDLDKIIDEEYPVLEGIKIETKIEEPQKVAIDKSLEKTLEASVIDEDKIRSAYKELQNKFKEAFAKVEKGKNLESMKKLIELRSNVQTFILEYQKDPTLIKDLARKIADAVRTINSL